MPSATVPPWMKLGLLVDLPEGLPLFFVSGPRNDPRTREQVASHLCFSCSNCFLIFGFLLAYFERLVLGCVEADVCKWILVRKLLTRSARFTYLCTAPKSKFDKIRLNSVKQFRMCAVFIFLFSSLFFIEIQHGSKISASKTKKNAITDWWENNVS